jgi:threonine dehydratase
VPTLPTYADVVAARERIRPHVRVTPVRTNPQLDAACGATLFFKCENLQATGAFKARGAHNAVFALAESAASRGVVTHSSGNHGAALALAGRSRQIPVSVVVPRGAAANKIESIRRYGGVIVESGPTLADRELAASQLQAESGAVFVHPSNDAAVISGQGTAALELLEQQPDIEALVAPVGGGGILSGTALAASGAGRPIAVYGGEPAGSDDAARSLAAGRILLPDHPKTIADGLRSALGDLTFAILRERGVRIFTVTEDQILEAMRLLRHVFEMPVEPSSAVAYAAVAANPDVFRGRRVGVILTGGNVDPALL